MKNIFLLLLAITIAGTACKRKNVRGDLKNRREMLQASNWKLVTMTANGGASSLPDCQKDNYYRFDPGSNGRYEEGEINCLDSTGTGNAPTYTPFIWQMPGDLRYIFFVNYGGDPEKRIEWEVLNMTFEELKVRQKLIENGIDIRLDMTYKAIAK